jgi:hypothetical protein
MRAAQVAVAVLVGVLIAAACTMFISDDTGAAWLFTAFGLFGFFSLLAMIVSDARPPRNLPPPR